MGTFVLGASRAEPGPFVASIAPGAVLLIDDREGGVEAALTSALMAAAATGDRAALLAAMRNASETHPACAAVLLDDERNSAFLFGPLVIVAETAGAQVEIRSTGVSVDELPLPSALTSVSVAPANGDTETINGDPPTETAFRATRIRLDLVPTVAPPLSPVPVAEPTAPVEEIGNALEPEPASAAAPIQPGPIGSEGVAPGPVEAHRLAETPAEPNPGPEGLDAEGQDAEGLSAEGLGAEVEGAQVLGVLCPRDHHNHPDAVYCAQCGLRMGVNQTLIARLGPRPPLGVLVLDDGSTMSIDGDLVIGREPQFHSLVVEQAAQAETVVDPELNLSRAHFALRLDGWSILAQDLGSSNGTYLQRDGHADWQPLATDHGTEVGSGDRLRAGSRVFQVQLHHVQG